MNSDLMTLNVGGDPRSFSDFAALKEELNKRFHPARPDIDWARAHGLCLSLFNQNGADLQTVAWFTLIRQHQAGINGLNEGLSLLERLISQHWQALWPLQTHARIEILSALSQQLISGLRGNTPVYSDLPYLYQAESILDKISQQLQLLELKHLSNLERLHNLLVSQIRNLESCDTPHSNFTPSPHITKTTKTVANTFHTQITEPTVSIKTTLSSNTQKPALSDKRRQPSYRRGIGIGFLIGILITSVCCVILLYSLSTSKKSNELVQILPALPQFTPSIASQLTQQLKYNHAQADSFPNDKLKVIDNYLSELDAISPIWAQQYGLETINYLSTQFSESPEIRLFNDKWQQNMQINAVSEKQLTQWNQGMEQLNNLSIRLDNLDGKPRSYITGSELKTIIFNARQHFNQGLPLEEELRRLEALQLNGIVPESEYLRIDNHFKQLLNRYALIKQNK
ncbi:VasL domain-containing protein [Moellerella wisconsensis]|uniref:VasL domain-containing protein n=1 Tax=Moellerella wisconsensis TaxID=158849 RepID=UPI0030767A2B